MRRVARWVVVLVAAALVIPDGAVLADRSADHKMELEAREAFAAGNYDQALNIFAKLYAETLHPVYLRNIARCHQKMRQPEKAIDAFQDYLAKAKKVPDDDRAEVDGYIHEMEALEREQRAASAATPTPTAAAATSATAAAVVTPPAPRALSAPAASLPPPTEASLLIVQQTAPAPSSAEASSITSRWWFWTAIGVVAVAAGGTVALLLSSSGTTRPPCTATVCR